MWKHFPNTIFFLSNIMEALLRIASHIEAAIEASDSVKLVPDLKVCHHQLEEGKVSP
jgi:hypothetical protein